MSEIPPEDTLHQEVYTVRTFEIDHHKQITIPALVRLMQEAAMQHVLQLKLSVWDLEPEQVAWVLMRMQLEVRRIPLLNEKIIIKTCPTGLERILTYRNFWIYDSEGTLIAEAVTHWVLMDTASRRLRQIPKWIIDRFSTMIPKTAVGLLPTREKFPKLSQVHHQKEFRVRWHDLDFNLHLNNTNYVLYLLEGMQAAFLSLHSLVKLDIRYKAEVRKEEQFEVIVEQLAADRFLHQLVQGDEKNLLAEMITSWQKRTD